MVNIGNDWDEILKDEWGKEYYQKLRAFLGNEYRSRMIYPKMHDIFNAFKHTSYKECKVVLLGQDPYHGAGQAHGLCFSVQEGCPPPPSLVNMFKEIETDVGHEDGSDGSLSENPIMFENKQRAITTVPVTYSGDLTRWAKQGVLLLNTVLTVRAGQAGSHRGQGWEILTDTVIKKLSDRERPLVFLLWGGFAKTKIPLIDTNKHLVLTAPHPSPLSAYSGFFGCKHFSKVNEFLERRGEKPIEW